MTNHKEGDCRFEGFDTLGGLYLPTSLATVKNVTFNILISNTFEQPLQTPKQINAKLQPLPENLQRNKPCETCLNNLKIS